MKLGNYTFEWEPDSFGIPKKERFNSHVNTYSGVAFFSWGVSIVGKIVSLEWAWMPAEQFHELQFLVEEDEEKVWDMEIQKRVWYKNPANHPFVAGKYIYGDTSGAFGLITAVDTINDNLKLSNVFGTFIHGEPFYDTSGPPKTGNISGIEIYPNYNVQILDLDGTYFENLRADFVWRKDVKMRLLIMSEAS